MGIIFIVELRNGGLKSEREIERGKDGKRERLALPTTDEKRLSYLLGERDECLLFHA